MIYLIVIILLLIGIYRYDYRQVPHGRFLYLIAVCSVLICVAGFRYNLGQDTFMYVKDYETLKPINHLKAADFQNTRFSPGYVVLASFFKLLTPEFTVFQFFHSLVVNTILCYFFYKNCRHVFFALFIYFFYLYFLLSFQQMREALAVCTFLLSWPFFRDGKWLYWYLAALLAFSFHLSAMVMFVLPAICLPGIKQLFVFGFRTWIICIGIALLAFVIQAAFFKYIELIAFTENMMERAQVYDKSILGGSLLNINGIIGNVIKFIAYPVLALYFLQKAKRKKGEPIKVFDKKIGMALMSVYISTFSIFVAIVGRYNNYFFPFAIIFVSQWIFSYLTVNGKKMRLQLGYWILIFIPMFGFNFYDTYFRSVNRSGTLKNYMMYYPYSSVFDQTEDASREKVMTYMRRKF